VSVVALDLSCQPVRGELEVASTPAAARFHQPWMVPWSVSTGGGHDRLAERDVEGLTDLGRVVDVDDDLPAPPLTASSVGLVWPGGRRRRGCGGGRALEVTVPADAVVTGEEGLVESLVEPCRSRRRPARGRWSREQAALVDGSTSLGTLATALFGGSAAQGPLRVQDGRHQEGRSVRQQVEETIEAIRPALQADGGDIFLREVDEETGVITVSLVGACGTCPASTDTLKAGIERIMKDRVDGIREVVAV
jgi:Fe-S cluster biogenesis protein NfuA